MEFSYKFGSLRFEKTPVWRSRMCRYDLHELFSEEAIPLSQSSPLGDIDRQARQSARVYLFDHHIQRAASVRPAPPVPKRPSTTQPAPSICFCISGLPAKIGDVGLGQYFVVGTRVTGQLIRFGPQQYPHRLASELQMPGQYKHRHRRYFPCHSRSGRSRRFLSHRENRPAPYRRFSISTSPVIPNLFNCPFVQFPRGGPVQTRIFCIHPKQFSALHL